MNSILVVGPSWVGDMVMSQSLFKAIKERDAETVIDVLAPAWSHPLLARMPEVRHAHLMPVGHGALDLKERYRVAQTLKTYAYDQAILVPNSWKSALIPWWAGIPRRTGFVGECRFGLLNDWRILDPKKRPKMVDRLVSLVCDKKAAHIPEAPLPRLDIDPAAQQAVIKQFALQSSLERPALVLCPGAEFGASKRWPEHYYAEVALQKHQEGWSVWILGSKKDQPIAAQIQEATGGLCLDLSGQTHLSEAIDLLSLATTVISNDSGLMHIAAALQKPLVAIYGSTDPGYTPPLGVQSTVVRLTLPCSPCFQRECPLGHHQCMQGLKPEVVLNALNQH